MSNLDDLPDILTYGEAAQAIGVTRLTLKRWEKRGMISSVRINTRGDRRYLKTDIIKLLAFRKMYGKKELAK